MECVACRKVISQPPRGPSRRCKACIAAKYWGQAPDCACGCKTPCNYNPGKGWNEYVKGHARRVTLRQERRNCRACERMYTPTATSQQRCQPCIDNKYYGEGPLCACGCGEHVRWHVAKKEWRTLLHGHYLRIEENKLRVGAPKKPEEVVWHRFICQGCNQEKKSKRPRRTYCSRACYGKSVTGEKSANWRGGLTSDGYVKDPQTGKKAHRRIMEDLIGRSLKSTEVVHHIDRRRTNNSPSNLFLFHCNACHMFHHGTNRPLHYKYGEVHHGIEMCCVMEEKICRPLARFEVVHQIDLDKSHADSDNLFLFHCDSCRIYCEATKVRRKYEYAQAHRTLGTPSNDNFMRRLAKYVKKNSVEY